MILIFCTLNGDTNDSQFNILSVCMSCLCQGDYVFASIGWLVSLFVCLSVSNITLKEFKQIAIKFYVRSGVVKGTSD